MGMLRKIILTLFILFTISFSAEINYSSKDVFPMHQDLEPAVRFWINVYAKYNTNQYVLHDARDMDIIYEVYQIGELNTGYADQPLSKYQQKILKSRTAYYKDILNAIAAVYPDSSRLMPHQKKVLQQLTSFKTKNDFYRAAKRIRAQKGQRNRFKHGLEKSGRYLPFLKEIFKSYGLPEELTALPHVESSFNYQAYSSVGAAGIWQFTRGTGKQFLKISYEVDERLDPLIATEAAAKLLSRNYKGVGHWPLAITAYNSGLSGMKRAIRKLGTTDIKTIVNRYKSRTFKFASRNFYCEFLAALHVVQNYQSYFEDINFEQPMSYKEFELSRYLKYETLAQHVDMDKEQFRKYNPALRPSVFNNSKYIPKGYRVRLPDYISVDSLKAAIPQTAYLAKQKRSEYYRIRFGDTISGIARRFGTTVGQLLALNNISNAHYIRRGMTIRIPNEKSRLPLLAVLETPVKKHETIINELMIARDEEAVVSLPFFWQEAGFADDTTSVASSTIYTSEKTLSDMEIDFVQTENPPIGYIRVEAEETLGHYADWLQVKTQRVRDWNNLSFRTAIHLNREIKLVFDKVSPDEFNRARLEYHRGLEEDFFANYEITDTLVHQVKKGENIWDLCNYEYNLPYWLVVDYNKDVDFATLKVGDKLTIPAIKSRG